MQSSRALRALPVVLGLVTPLSLTAQARYRVTTDGAWFYQEPGGKRLARLARGAVLMGGETQGDWQGVILEGWIFTTSVGPTPRAGYDLAVTRAPEENLRSAPAGALIGKLPQGFLLTRVAEGTSGRWLHVTRAGWVEKTDLESIAQVASSRSAAPDSDTTQTRPTLPKPAVAPATGHGSMAGSPDTYRVTTDGAWFFQEPGGKRLARVARGAVLIGGEAQGDWQGVILEGWIFTTSVGPTPRAGYDLTVTRAPEENLRSAPAGALIGKLPQGFLLNRVAEGSSGRWIHVTRAGWVEKTDLESIAQVASSRSAAPDSGTTETRPTLPKPAVAPATGHGSMAGSPDTYRVTTDGAWFFQEPGGKRLARVARGAVLIGGEAQGDWQGVILEGWIFTTSVGPTPRAGYDLTVTRAPEENLRSAPAGALIGKLPQGFLLNRVAEGSSGRWIHVTR